MDSAKYLSVNGSKIHYELINTAKCNPENPFLVFLHDGLGSIQQWKDFPGALSRIIGLPALIYDRCGHGKSGKLMESHKLNYFNEEALKILPEILKLLEIDNKLILIGHSDGGSIALIYTSEFQDNVKCVITEATHVFTEEVTLEGIRNAVSKYRNGDFKYFLEKYHGNNTESMFRGWSNLWLDKDFRNWNIRSLLKKIECPLLAIQGEEDEYGTLEQVNIIMNEVKCPAESLIIKNCEHIPHHQAREFVLENMVRFIIKIL